MASSLPNLNTIKLCLVTSSGGHLFLASSLGQWWQQHDRFWITRRSPETQAQLKNERVFYAHFPENRNFINSLKNFFLALKILNQEKPNLIFSTGAGIAPPFFLAAKLLNIKSVFLEAFVFASLPTLSGKIIYHFRLSDLFLVQNKYLLTTYPRAKYWGSII